MLQYSTMDRLFGKLSSQVVLSVVACVVLMVLCTCFAHPSVAFAESAGQQQGAFAVQKSDALLDDSLDASVLGAADKGEVAQGLSQTPDAESSDDRSQDAEGAQDALSVPEKPEVPENPDENVGDAADEPESDASEDEVGAAQDEGEASPGTQAEGGETRGADEARGTDEARDGGEAQGVDAAQTQPMGLSATEGVSTKAAGNQLQDMGVTMHRLYNPYSGEHFYTASTSERDSLSNVGWRYEGIGWIAPSSGAEVYRLYNPFERLGDHHYTMSAEERNWLVSLGWRYEGVGWYSGGSYKVLRQYNPYAYKTGGSGAHNYTISAAENNHLVSVGWQAEGVGWYALADTPATQAAFIAANSAGVRAVVAYLDDSGESHDFTVSSVVSGDTTYICLPSFADLAKVKLVATFKGADVALLLANSGSRDFVALPADQEVDVSRISNVTAGNGARLYWFTTDQTSYIQRLGIMVSAMVSSVYINSVDPSMGRGYVEASPDHTAKADVIVTVIGADGTVLYDKDTAAKPATIKGRGNNTWGIGNKKPYQISLNKKFDFTGKGGDNAQKKWILLANANDVTMLHTTIAYNIGLELDMVGTECVVVDLYYDGEYRGSYLVCEKVQIKEGRIDITDLEELYELANEGVDLAGLPVGAALNEYGYTYRFVSGVADPDDITGGYLLEIDNAYYSGEICRFDCSWGVVVVKSPEYCSQAAMEYISTYFEATIRNLYAGIINSGRHTFDLESLAKAYIVNEFAKNIDAFYTSTFFYKDKGADSMVFAQPLWDFDACMGVRSDRMDWAFASYHGFVVPATRTSPTGTVYGVATVSAVQEKARQIWQNELSPLVKNVLLSNSPDAIGANGFLHSLVYYRQEIAASQRMNQVVFGLTAFENEITPYSTYDANYNYLVNWLGWRTAWMDDNIVKLVGSPLAKDYGYWYGDKHYDLVFDPSYYKAVNPDLAHMTDAQALEHFVKSGMAEGRLASRNFNVAAYKNRYADLRQQFGNNLQLYYEHYVEYGFIEGRNAL